MADRANSVSAFPVEWQCYHGDTGNVVKPFFYPLPAIPRARVGEPRCDQRHSGLDFFQLGGENRAGKRLRLFLTGRRSAGPYQRKV